MSDFDTELDSERFLVGRTLSRSFSIFFRHIVTLGAIALLVQLVPMVISMTMFADLFAAMNSGDPEQIEKATLNVGPEGIGYLILQAVSFFLTLFITAAVIFGAIAILRDRPASIVDCLKGGLSRFLPTVGVSLILFIMLTVSMGVLIGVGIAIGESIGALMAIPALILAAYLFVLFYAAIPAAVAERPGVFGAFTRSLELTKGSRWRVFALILAVFGIAIFGSILIWIPIGMFVPLLGFTVTTIAGYIMASLMTVFMLVVMAVAYHDLRIALEGLESEDIAEVFE